VQNGVGYDTFMSTIENADPNSARKVINVQQLLGLPDSTPNPHLWYNPTTMPAVANAIAADLAQLDPAHASYFKANAASFISSLTAWNSAIAAFKSASATGARGRCGSRLMGMSCVPCACGPVAFR
jgi:zinc/manganese transport system substrate-binding protein